MYNLYLDEFQWHFPTEDDRTWLEEALANQTLITASDAIRVAAESDPTANIVYLSQIVSTQVNNERVSWMHHIVNRSAKVMDTDGLFTHPNYRGQGITKRLYLEYVRWLKINNPFDVDSISAVVPSNIWFMEQDKLFEGEGYEIRKASNINGGDDFTMQEIALK